jgi:hypothetical protein
MKAKQNQCEVMQTFIVCKRAEMISGLSTHMSNQVDIEAAMLQETNQWIGLCHAGCIHERNRSGTQIN